MARRTAVVAALATALVLVGSAAGDNSQKIEQLHERIAAAHQREAALNSQIADVTTKIRSLERQVGDVSQRLTILERDLALHQQRLAKLNELFVFETKRLHFLQSQYRAAVTELNRRLVQLYESPNPSVAEVILDSGSVQEAIDTLHYLSAIAAQDQRIARAVAAARNDVHATRERTKKVRAVVASETHIVAIRTDQQRQAKDQLLASQHRLSGARSSEKSALASTKELEQQWIQEANDLAAQDARVRSQLAQAQAHTSSTPSASGLIWPVSGPVVSPFGMRWGRLHAGIDIAVPSGTPIHAAASGTVAIAGWVDGYGNYTCIDHGGGLATCYGHQSSIAVGTGAHVTQGQVIGYSGCTGHCLGPHVHFEVRINGSPVDPLGYL
ncbi:MAG: murein hydrolase activator EnvC family protein [Gaiellaceae bacterium]|jgi:murein DD-endopeptidase MepM/ murein hydrolase activator NlpD